MKNNIFQKLYLLWYKFIHFFTYKKYTKYNKSIFHNRVIFGIIFAALVASFFGTKKLGIMTFSLIYIWLILIAITTLRGLTLEKTAKKLTQYFNIKELRLRIYDYAPFDEKNKVSKIAIQLFPNKNLFIVVFNRIKNLIFKPKIEPYTKEIQKLHEIICFYLKNPNNEKDEKYYFYVTLPNDDILFNQFNTLFNKNHMYLKLTNEKPFNPTKQLSDFYLGEEIKKWNVYEIKSR